MDTLSHGLWGGVAFGRKRRIDFWMAFLFGVLPDLLSFGIFTVGSFLGFFERLDFGEGRVPDPSLVPGFVHASYDVTHSLIVFILVFILVRVIRREYYWPLAAWGLHILYDIPTHSAQFFPTPFLWPVSDFFVDGVSWGHPYIFFPNWIALIVSLFIFFWWDWWKKWKNTRQKPKNAL